MKPMHATNSDFMSILYSKPLSEDKEPTVGNGDSIRLSKYDLPIRN